VVSYVAQFRLFFGVCWKSRVFGDSTRSVFSLSVLESISLLEYQEYRKRSGVRPLPPVRLGPPCRRPILNATKPKGFRRRYTGESSTAGCHCRLVGTFATKSQVLPRGGITDTMGSAGSRKRVIRVKHAMRLNVDRVGSTLFPDERNSCFDRWRRAGRTGPRFGLGSAKCSLHSIRN
jgi:hypothetical protein